MKIANLNTNPRDWIAAQIAHDAPSGVPFENMLYQLCLELFEDYRLVSSPHSSMLLWPRCTPGENLDDLPVEPKDLALHCIGPLGLSLHGEKRLLRELKKRGIICTERFPVHPDRFAFRFAFGDHPPSWTFHHLYDGMFPFPGKKTTMDARKHGRHFTQTAGMAVIHPIVQELYDFFPCIRRVLRARSFKQFKYDPDHYFEKEEHHDQLGFVIEKPMRRGVDALDDVPDDLAPAERRTFPQNIRERLAAEQRVRAQEALNEDD